MEDKKEMANHMQEKNFEKQMEERIRESAKSLDVPPELKPEKLEELLEKRGREKNCGLSADIRWQQLVFPCFWREPPVSVLCLEEDWE